jgi:PleD family two-component response regulator
MKWLKWMMGTSRAANGKHTPESDGVPGVLDRESFERELQRHRAMCNRAGGQFILMVFDVATGDRDDKRRAAFKKLSGVLALRVRMSDLVGRFDTETGRIGVILPQTDGAGAERFLKAVEELMRRSMNGTWTPEFRLKCEMFGYPEVRAAVIVAADEKAPAGGEPVVAKTR